MGLKIIIVVMLCLVILAGVLVLVLTQESCPDTTTCLPLKECYELHKGGNSFNSTLLFSCSDRTGSVCCPELLALPEQPEKPEKPVMTLAAREAKMNLLPLDICGIASVVRINEGQVAGLGAFPWMTLLSFKVNGTSNEHAYLCGGTLISSKYVLTAAHCVNTEHGLPVSVRLGELNLDEELDCTDEYCADPPVDIDVERVIAHQKYNMPYLKNDIALLRLKTAAPRSDYIIPICLPFNINITGDEENRRFTIAGWGKSEDASINGSSELLYAYVDNIPVAECDEAQTLTPLVRPISDLQLCAGGLKGQDACKGDSGGPLTEKKLDESARVREYQVGIVSFGSVTCGGRTPSVYTRLTSYLNWILMHLEP